MELRDYLMPGEYILGVIRKIKVKSNGDFNNLAITNKRFIPFNNKRKIIPFGRDKEEISNMHSIVFDNSPAIQILRNKERIYILVCDYFNRDIMEQMSKNKETYYCHFTNDFSIYATFNGPSLFEIFSMIMGVLGPLIKKKLVGSGGKEWETVVYLLFKEGH